MDYFERMAIIVTQHNLEIALKKEKRKAKLELQIKDINKDYKKCYCGYVYNNFEHYYKRGECKGRVLESRIKEHLTSNCHLKYINYSNNYNGVIRQLNCIVRNLKYDETLLNAVLKNKFYHKLNKR